jgi:hypothetical protein
MFTTTSSFRCGKAAAGLTLFIALTGAAAAQDAQPSLNGFMAWEGEGRIYETGPNLGTFVGAIAGPLFIQTEKGPAAAGEMVCPVLLEIDLLDATQAGEGKCVVTGDDGAKAFADWACRGVHRIGCDGEITLTGGTGRLQGITGKGSLSVRTISGVGITAATADGTVAEIARGLLTIDELTYSLPEQ